ncbi:4'-phosphopantetheinyl transferase superfamily protein [Fluviicola sp.]|jgi:4'-phosphopantetheinyl transferase EntD|uniref:4'-phosphopantetheinyl transferase family protein n=1 Tax=Fluviicola sp. TaxID=1917219 RepID=UPI00282A5EA8|nr:4'-phosphopantetheinyl transferase superfamily protein [Fluviicola sp.]MDR0802857.1 4'-phosphopantetheinyl transferase superfamily protein [Fluviicola sp.]
MPDISVINLNAVSIYLMEIESSYLEYYQSSFTLLEQVKIQIIGNPGKKLEYAASRYLKHYIFGSKNIAYDSTGAPYIEGVGFISLSHCQSYVAVAVCSEHLIGVDIEEIREKSVKLSSRFITEAEKKLFNPGDKTAMSTLWSLKECLYKLSDRKQLLFQKDILVYKRNGVLYGSILKTAGIHEYKLHIEHFRNILITFNSGKGKLVHEHSI